MSPSGWLVRARSLLMAVQPYLRTECRVNLYLWAEDSGVSACLVSSGHRRLPLKRSRQLATSVWTGGMLHRNTRSQLQALYASASNPKTHISWDGNQTTGEKQP